MTPRSARKPKSAQPPGKKSPVGRSPKKRVLKKGQPNGPIGLTSSQEKFLEAVVLGMLDEAPPAPKPKPLGKNVPGKTELLKNRFKPST